MSMPTVGIAGMTHLGLVTASAIASKGFATVCYDVDSTRIEALARGELQVVEPGLDELVVGSVERITFTSKLDALQACDIVYIARDVPTDDAGQSDLSPITQLILDVGGVLGAQALLVILCQVPPGFTRALKLLSHERIYYQVETLIFGRAVARALEPERFIIGCADPKRPLDPRFAALLGTFNCPIIPMRYESAELTKIAINLFLVSSVSLTNMLAELCEAIGADWSEIAPALKLDRRIGPYAYLAPGLGIAGGNLERDLATIERIAANRQVDVGLVGAWRAVNSRRRDWALETIQAELLDRKPEAVLAIWGLAYKEIQIRSKIRRRWPRLCDCRTRDCVCTIRWCRWQT